MKNHELYKALENAISHTIKKSLRTNYHNLFYNMMWWISEIEINSVEKSKLKKIHITYFILVKTIKEKYSKLDARDWNKNHGRVFANGLIYY